MRFNFCWALYEEKRSSVGLGGRSFLSTSDTHNTGLLSAFGRTSDEWR